MIHILDDDRPLSMIDITPEEFEFIRRMVHGEMTWLEDTPKWGLATNPHLHKKLAMARQLSAKIGYPDYEIALY